jgi:FkbM family methyltransferase
MTGMEISSFVYKQYLGSSGVHRRVWIFIRNSLIKLFNDPICSLPIHGWLLKLPLSHALPEYLLTYPYYDRLPTRISAYILRRYGYLNCIDVGANIVDTIAAFYKTKMDRFLAIEPHLRYRKLLQDNWRWNKNVAILPYVCSSTEGEDAYEIQEKDGTAVLVHSQLGTKMIKMSLDAIIKTSPNSSDCNVLKIDTDGHDIDVISGSIHLLKRNLPVVLFECASLENPNFINDTLGTMKLLQKSGYNHFIIYDNFGCIMGKFSISDLSYFQDLLFYCQISSFYYFDILAMRDEDLFPIYNLEIEFFLSQSLKDTSPGKAL